MMEIRPLLSLQYWFNEQFERENQRILDKRNRPAKAFVFKYKKSPIGIRQMGCNSPGPVLTKSVIILITV